MADNYITNPGAGGATFAGDEDGLAVQWPLIKLAWGQLDTFNILADAAGKRMPVNLAEVNVTVPVSGPLTDVQIRATPVPVSANQGTAAAVAGAWPILLTDGTRTATVKAASTASVAADLALVVTSSPNGLLTVSTNNSSTASLGISGVFTGTTDTPDSFTQVQISVFSDQNGTLAAQFSIDNANWDESVSFPYVSANGGTNFECQIRARFFRIVYTNGVIAQTLFRLKTLFRPAAPSGDSVALRDDIPANAHAQLTRSLMFGPTAGGGSTYAQGTVKAASTAALATDPALVVAISPNGTVSSKTDLAPASPTTAAVGVASGSAVAANASRKGLHLRNTSTSGQRLSLSMNGAAVLDSGITLYPQDIFEMNEYDFDLGVINAIASAAAASLAVQEFA